MSFAKRKHAAFVSVWARERTVLDKFTATEPLVSACVKESQTQQRVPVSREKMSELKRQALKVVPIGLFR